MNFPKLKHPILCRFTPYVVVLGCSLLPIILVFRFPVPDGVRLVVLLGSLAGLLIYIMRNFLVLMALDITLASLSCMRTARTEYPLYRSPEAIRKSVLRYGHSCEPVATTPQPAALRYRFSSPMTVYSRGIERVIAAYETEHLEGELYRSILRSAKVNSKALTGRKKALFLDSTQKKQPLHRVTVVLILAHHVDPTLIPHLYDTVCKQCGREDTDCVVPCVVDLEHNRCVFNSLRLVYAGFGYPVKNRGIRIIRHLVFGGSLPWKDNPHILKAARKYDPEASLWKLWRDAHNQILGADRAVKRRFRQMVPGEITEEGGSLYLLWDQRGICQKVALDEDSLTAAVSPVTQWTYPEARPIGKKTIRKIEEAITVFYEKQGYKAVFQIADSDT